LSPLLSNLVLDELDCELGRRGHRFVRYADDGNSYVRSERAGQRVMKSITRFITQKLKLKVNEVKSAVARPQERKFLGFSFTAGPDIKRIIAPKSLDRFKQRIREITRRAKGVSIETTMEELASYMRGARLFRLLPNARGAGRPHSLGSVATAGCAVAAVENTTSRRATLIALRVMGQLRNTAASGRGPWHIARSKALSVGLSNAYFKSLGLPSLIEAR
jgi:RNA-directed DNA polymerase